MKNKEAAILWNGVSDRVLCKIEPAQFTDVSLQLTPVLPGLHNVSGLKIVDLLLKRTYEYPDIAQIFVLHS